MNILAITWHFPPSIGGMETNLYNLYKNMIELGENVTVVTTLSKCPPNTKTEEVFNGMKVYRVNSFIELVKKIKSLSENADILHVHEYTTALAALPTKLLTKLPMVIDCHGYDMMCLKANLYRNGTVCEHPMSKYCLICSDRLFPRAVLSLFLMKLIGSKIDGWSAISDYVANRITSVHKIPEGRMKRVYNGVDYKKFKDVHKEKAKEFLVNKGYAKEGDIVVLITSRMEEIKGQRLVMESIPYIIEKNGNVKFVFVGYGDDYEHLVSLSKKLKISENVVFAGKTRWREMPYFYKSADIFITPSLWPEAFGNITTEAMASGLPIIGTNRGATPELVKNNENGYIIEPISSELIEELDILINDEGLRKKMGKRSIELSKKYSWEDAAKKMIEMFEQVRQ